MKRFFIIILTFIATANIYSQFSGGAGTADNPYKITSRADMEELADSVADNNSNSPDRDVNWSAGKYFILMNDINDSVRTLSCGMEVVSDYGKCFQGNFNGNNKKITLALVHWQQPSFIQGYCVSLFPGICNAEIYDLTVDGYVKGYSHIGGICGAAYKSYILNCKNYCNVTGMESYMYGSCVGGICGEAYDNTNISDCINYGTIYSANYSESMDGQKMANVGGIVGSAIANYYIKGCTNYGNVAGNYLYIGGIAGLTGCLEVSNCHNYGNVTGEHAVGGITGCLANPTYSEESPDSALPCILSYCTNSGTITATSAVGGIAGHTHNKIDISYSINIGTVRGDSAVGGIASGYDNNFAEHNGTINTCHNSGLVIGNNIVGGIQGRCWGNISNSLNTGVVIGNTNTGGIAGETNNTAIIRNCHYDKQMCIHGGIAGKDIAGQAEGYLTKELIGNNLQAKLGNTDWTFNNANLYPTLKHFEKDSVAFVASSPVYLYDGDVSDFDKQNRVKTDFKVNLENDVKWNRIIGNVDIVNDDGLVRNNGSDTLVASIGNYKKLVPINIQLLPIGDVKFTIWATEHKQIAPTETNYSIPIYIKSNAKTLRAVTINKLIIEIDKDIFYSKHSDNGTLASKNQNEITIENIKIPALNAGKEVVLFNLIGDMLLGTIDSSEIIIDANIEFVEDLATNTDTKNGYITLNICREGSDRFIEVADNSPSLSIKNNPVEDILEVECNVLESGKYVLEVVDMTGRSVKVEEFVAGGAGAFLFDVDAKQFGIGSYILTMKTHSKAHSAMFSIMK